MPDATPSIRRCIVHRVPKRLVHQADGEPILADRISPLDDVQVVNRLAERLNKNLTTAYGVTDDPAAESPVPALVRGILERPDELVIASQGMARHLHSVQGGVNPAGILLVLDVGIASRRGLAIMKVEEEEAVKLADTEVDGGRTFELSLLRELFLTQKTRVYKVAIFELDGEALVGRVADRQKGPGTTVAGFFLKDFLGCRLAERADTATQRFLLETEKFFNDQIADPFLRTRYTSAVLAELQSNRDQIHVGRFAQDNLEIEHRQPFTEFLTNAGVATVVPKDLRLIKHLVDHIEMKFVSGVRVLASRDQMEKHIKVASLIDGDAQVTITDRLKRANSHS